MSERAMENRVYQTLLVLVVFMDEWSWLCPAASHHCVRVCRILEQREGLVNASVSVSIVEVYNNNVHDLLSEDPTENHKARIPSCRPSTLVRCSSANAYASPLCLVGVDIGQ